MARNSWDCWASVGAEYATNCCKRSIKTTGFALLFVSGSGERMSLERQVITIMCQTRTHYNYKSATTCSCLLTGNNSQQFAAQQMICKDQLNCNPNICTTGTCPARTYGVPRRSRTASNKTADCIGTSLTLPKLHWATLNLLGCFSFWGPILLILLIFHIKASWIMCDISHACM